MSGEGKGDRGVREGCKGRVRGERVRAWGRGARGG